MKILQALFYTTWMTWIILFSASIQRAISDDTKSIEWNITDIPLYGYEIKNMDKNQTYIILNGQDAKPMNNAFRFNGDPENLTKTVKVEISNVSMEHGGYIAVTAGGKVYGGVVLVVQGMANRL